MAKKPDSQMDAYMRDYMRGLTSSVREQEKLAKYAAESGPTENAGRRDIPQETANAYAESEQAWNDANLMQGGRDLGEHIQDAASGLMGTFGAIGGVADLATSLIHDSAANLVPGGETTWDRTTGAFERMESTREYWQSLQSEKSNAFDRVSQYRQQRAVDQANSQAFAETGEMATAVDRMAAEFGASVGNYMTEPGQILTDGIAQLPYILTGGVAKGVTSGTKLANPLIGKLIRKGMSREAATKLVQMGLVGGQVGTLEGAEAASSAYANVMGSENTFGPEEEGAQEAAALKAAATAFGITAPVAAVTGLLASKFELNPFSALGRNSLTRSSDNLIKALQEGIEETIQSGTSQFAGNYGANSVLDVQDQVSLDQGVGGAAGAGLVVGMGSTVVTNPRSVVDAAAVPLVLAGKAVGYVGNRAVAAERKADMTAASTTADEIVANLTTPAAAAAMNAGVSPQAEFDQVSQQLKEIDAALVAKYGENHFDKGELLQDPEYAQSRKAALALADQQADLFDRITKNQDITTDTAPELVGMPPGVRTDTQVGLFATGMEYLRGKDMNSKDAVDAFHVLGAVLAAANNIRSLRDASAKDAADTTLPEADREKAAKNLTQLKAIMKDEQLDKWVNEMPMEDIEADLENLRQNPENFGAVIAHLAAMNPLKTTEKLLEVAHEAKSLTPKQRDSLALAKELKEAAAELKGTGKPDSDGVTRSMMQTGFPGSTENDSVAGYISQVTTALDQGDATTAQTFFHRLVKFANFEQGRAAAYEAADKQLSLDPDSKRIELNGYYQLGDNGKLDRSKPQFVDKKALDLVKTVRKDADAIQKMVAALTKRTGLKAVEAAPKAEVAEAPQKAQEAAPAPKAPDAPAKAEKAAPAPVAKAATVQETSELAGISDAALAKGIDTLVKTIQRRRNNDTAKALDQDIQYDNLVREQARRMQTSAEPVPTKAVGLTGKPSAPVAIDIVDDVVEASAEVAIETRMPVEQEPSNNHFTDLQPSYPVAEGATVVEQNDAKNHLSQSFSTSERTGLLSKLPETVTAFLEDLGLVGKDAAPAAKVFSYKDQIVARLQDALGKKFPKTRRLAMLGGQNFWKEPNAHSLYAAVWDEAGIAYDSVIADVMAWTGVQQLLDMVNPVSWSAEKQAAFVATYGDSILPMLQDGWVPLADQVHQVAQKLQANLELTPDATVSTEYTEGTMLSLAMDALSVMIRKDGQPGHLVLKQLTTLEGPTVQWIRIESDLDVLHDSARALEGFFPERSSAAAGIVGTKPDKVNPLYRGSRQKVGKQQRKALLKMSQTSHKLSPLLLNLWKALPEAAAERLFGFKETVDDPMSLAEIAQDGANKTLKGDMRTIKAHVKAVMDHAAANEVEITDVESFFEYEMVVNGRAMTKGTSPQSSKLYRELFSTVQAQVDPSKDNRGFLMAVAQGLGIKMDKQPVQTSLDQLSRWLAQPSVIAGLAAADRLTNGNMESMDGDIAALLEMKDDEGKAIEMSAHGLSAMVHMAQYQKGQPFVSSLSYEIDGLTDGPINLMMLMGLKGSSATMEHWLGLGGLWFGDTKIAVQDKLEELKGHFDGSKDLYEIIAAKASELNAEQARRLLASVPKDQQQQTQRMLQAILHLMHITKLSQSDLRALTAKHSRSFTKKPTQAAGYMQGGRSIVSDLANTMLDALSSRIDANQMTDGDWAAVDMLLSNKLVYSKAKKQHFLIKDPDEYRGLEWEGAPLNGKQKGALVSTLLQFGGSGLADATMETIGLQRARMFDAVGLVNAHIKYAQETLQEAYKAKQEEQVELGRLHPNQALSKQDEQALIKQVWESIIPHPMLRNTGGLPSSSTTRTGVPMQNVRRVEGALFQPDRGNANRDKSKDEVQNLQVSEASFEDPGVSFAALSIMAAGDGSMMTGFFGNTEGNFLNMFDGIYLDPSQIDMVGEAINKEVKQNWEHDYIGAVLDSLKMQDADFRAWADAQEVSEGVTLLDQLQESVHNLEAQRKEQTSVMADINSRPHSVSHMAGHNNPHFQEGTPLNSTTLGTSTTDPLLDLAADELGHAANGIRKMSKSDVVALLKDHTFENPVLSGLWKVLAPLLSDNLTVFMSSDKQGMADFYQQNELREMGQGVDGVSIGDRVYIRAINAETMVHELLHATTKNLTATYFSKPEALTAQQRTAMKNLLALQDQFLTMDTDGLPPHQQAMVEHVQAIMRGLDQNSALQEFLAYGLSNYHLQRTLGNTKSALGQLVESVFNAVKALFGFPNGTQSDSMLAQMFSNFGSLTQQATGVAYPVTVETALNAVNPNLARSFEGILTRLEQRSATVAKAIGARADAKTRMQELAHTGLFPMTNEQQAAAEYVQAMFSAGLQIKGSVNSLLQRVVDAVREAGPDAFRTNQDPSDIADITRAQGRYEFFFENPSSAHDRAADILSLSLVNPEFAERMNAIVLDRQKIDKSSANNWLDSSAKALYEWGDTGLALKPGATLNDALEQAAVRMRKSLEASVIRQQATPGLYRKATDKLAEGVQFIGKVAGDTAASRQALKKNTDWISVGLNVVAGVANDHYADQFGKMVLSLTNHLEGYNPLREIVQETVGTVSDNYRLIQLKGIAARMVSSIRQSFREQVPVSVKSWFKDLTPEQDAVLHKVIGQNAVYTLSQGMKDRLVEILTDPTNAMQDVQMVLMGSGDRTKRALMIKYAKHLGDYMADKGTQALYRNTRAVAGLAGFNGTDRLSDKEMAALEDLSTIQALSHLTKADRAMTLDLVRNQPEAFWKTTALIHSFQEFDTRRAGQDSATLNFQKGWIPVESDGRKKVRLMQVSEVRKAERMGWVQVAKDKADPNMVYMATTVGQTPTLSGGAIHAVDMHMNGIHFHSGMPTIPGIQTTITHPKAVREILDRILNGEVMPYTVLYDASGDAVGFQRLLDPAILALHTRDVRRISDAAGIWLGRLHEEQAAHGQNRAAAKLLGDTWKDAPAERKKEFVDIRQIYDPASKGTHKVDKVLANVWKTLPFETKRQLEAAFADGSKNPPIMIRRDQLNDAIGYHKASVGNFFTGDNRFDKATNDHVAAFMRQLPFLGKNAYKYMVMGEAGWQGIISTAKDTIIVKSLTIALVNIASNQTQLLMITGNPVWNARVQMEKHKELVSYLGYQQRHARLTAEDLATDDPKAKARIKDEKAQLKRAMRALSIYPLIEAGEMPVIAEGLSETEEFSMVGDATAWLENQVGKLPPMVGTVLNNLAVSKETSLYKGMDRMIQYGDFVAKATMYEWLTTKDAATQKKALEMVSKNMKFAEALHHTALMEVNDEFVNYARLPGRYRTYGEDMGLLWFYNYKMRMLKMGFRRIRKNPAGFLIGTQVGGLLGIPTLLETMPGNVSLGYSTGIDPLFTAHQTIIWNQMF